MEQQGDSFTPGTDGAFADGLAKWAGFSDPAPSPKICGAVFLKGGREADSFYRDRWSHDKEVRSTHGVNCTGSCSWKVYVKDGIITWETQQTDYPLGGTGLTGVRTARLPARSRVQLVHLLAHPRAVPVRARLLLGVP